MIATALLALLLQAAPQAVPPPAKATVSGVVVNGNGEPVANMKVTMGKLGVSLGPFTSYLLGDRPTRETTLTADTFIAMSAEIEAEIAGGGIPPEEMRAMQAFKSFSVADIHEITVTPTGGMSVVYKSAPPITTDATGRFTFSVDPGSYRLSFSGVGYAKVDYGQKSSSGLGTPLTLTPGQTKTDIVMRVMPVGAVSGRIRDNVGQAVAGVPVEIFRFIYDVSGKRTKQRVTSTRTNDLGEYRMYYLTPGRYYVSAGSAPGANPNQDYIFLGGAGVVTTQNRIQVTYAQTFFPGVPRESEASPVEVPPGSDLRGVDLFVTQQQTYKVRGRVVDARTGQPPQTVQIQIAPQTTDINSYYGGSVGNPNYKPADGSFELSNVAAGAYILSATVARTNTLSINFDAMSPSEQQEYFRTQRAEDLLRPKASVPLTVVGDLDGIVLSMGLNGTISGTIRAEGNATPSLDFVRVQFTNDVPTNILEGGPNPRPVVDGAFKVENIRPGEYRVVLAGMPEGFYLKAARVGQTDVLSAPIRYAGGDASGLELVLSPNVGIVDGATEPGATVVLIPARNRERTEMFRPVTADSSGHFEFKNVTPAEYTLVAWESIEPFSFFDPSLIRVAEMQGKAVRVEESSKQTVNVPAIK